MSRLHRAVPRGDLMLVLERLEAHQEALQVAESLLAHDLVASTMQFVGWRVDDRIYVLPDPLAELRGKSLPVGTGSISRGVKVREDL